MNRRLRSFGWAASAATLLLLASCGGDAAPNATERGAVATEQQTKEETEEAPTGLICDDPPPTEIALETPITSEIEGWGQCFTVEVPGGSAGLTIELTGLTGSLNLRVAYNDPEIIQYLVGELWESMEDDTADEIVTIENPQSGTYYINVVVGTYRAFSSFTLSASTS